MKYFIIAGFRDLTELQEYAQAGVIEFDPPRSNADHIHISCIDLENQENNVGATVSVNQIDEPLRPNGVWNINVVVDQYRVTGLRLMIAQHLLNLVGIITRAKYLDFTIRGSE